MKWNGDGEWALNSKSLHTCAIYLYSVDCRCFCFSLQQNHSNERRPTQTCSHVDMDIAEDPEVYFTIADERVVVHTNYTLELRMVLIIKFISIRTTYRGRKCSSAKSGEWFQYIQKIARGKAKVSWKDAIFEHEWFDFSHCNSMYVEWFAAPIAPGWLTVSPIFLTLQSERENCNKIE